MSFNFNLNASLRQVLLVHITKFFIIIDGYKVVEVILHMLNIACKFLQLFVIYLMRSLG
jgi:hypothetical protein